MEKRTILAIVLAVAVMAVWFAIQSKFFPPEQQKPVQTQEAKQEAKREQPVTPEKGAELKKEVSVKKEVKEIPKTKLAPRKEVTIETENFWAVFTSEDAKLVHFKLKKYQSGVEESPFAVKLVHFVDRIIGKKEKEFLKPEPLDLVNTKGDTGLPMGLTFNPPLPASVDPNWEINQSDLQLTKAGEKGEIAFVKNFENGLKVIKRYSFSAEKNVFDVEIEVQNNSAKDTTSQIGLEWVGKIELAKLADEDIKDYGLKYAVLKNQKVESKEFGGASSSGCTPGCSSTKTTVEPMDITEKGDISWFSFEGEYFTALLIPPPKEKNASLSISVKGGDKNILTADMMTSPVIIQSGQTVKVPYRVYLGPKDEDRLAALGVGAEKLIDFGYFTVVAKPLLWFLRLTNKMTHNFGIDILILSILIKIIFLPLTQISFKSMKEMQKVQPEMARLKETFKNDKARLQQEIMLLYKRRKINPMSGCLPMLIQIPVFIALYNALQKTIEMRHSPFFLWIKDLSGKDPLYIMPIIMGASMVIQQKMTPTAADPAQAKLFLLMPVMFTFIFLNFPSGLVLYWLVNNVLSIAHQSYLNKKP
jgi:YidC/Oxa1 family membrane protein insertase